MERLSVIIPAFNEEKNVKRCDEKLRTAFRNASVEPEVLFINDGSSDGTENAVLTLRASDPNIKLLSFKTNRGKEAAMRAGLRAASGKVICITDVDGQISAEALTEMYTVMETKHLPLIAAVRKSRKKNMRNFFSVCFYHIFRIVSGLYLPDGATDFIMMSREAADALLAADANRGFLKGAIVSCGIPVTWFPFEPHTDSGRKSRWNMTRLFLYAWNALRCYRRSGRHKEMPADLPPDETFS